MNFEIALLLLDTSPEQPSLHTSHLEPSTSKLKQELRQSYFYSGTKLYIKIIRRYHHYIQGIGRALSTDSIWKQHTRL